MDAATSRWASRPSTPSAPAEEHQRHVAAWTLPLGEDRLNAFMAVAGARLTVEDRGVERPPDLAGSRHAGVFEKVEASAAIACDGVAMMDVKLRPAGRRVSARRRRGDPASSGLA